MITKESAIALATAQNSFLRDHRKGRSGVLTGRRRLSPIGPVSTNV